MYSWPYCKKIKELQLNLIHSHLWVIYSGICDDNWEKVDKCKNVISY